MAKDLTKNDVERAKPQAKPYELRDGKTRGLVLRVQPTGKRSWVCEYRVAGRKTRRTIGDASVITLAQARSQASEILNQAMAGVDVNEAERKEKATTLSGYIEAYYKPYAQQHILSHDDILKRLERNFKDLYNKPLTQISETDIERWRKRKSKAKNPVTFETLQREFTYLKAALNLAVKEFKLISGHQLERYNLKRRVNSPERSNTQKVRYLTPEEETRLRAALRRRDARIKAERQSANRWRKERGYDLYPTPGIYVDHIEPIVLLALNTGLRRGDLFTLEWAHIDLKNAQIRKVINKTSRSKGKDPATLPLSKEAVTVLLDWQADAGENALVFPSPVNDGPLDNINKAWRAVIDDAEIEGFRFHDLRHSFASKLVMGGVDLNTVRELMTHSDIKMTLIYAHLSPDHKAAAIERVFADAPREARQEAS